MHQPLVRNIDRNLRALLQYEEIHVLPFKIFYEIFPEYCKYGLENWNENFKFWSWGFGFGEFGYWELLGFIILK